MPLKKINLSPYLSIFGITVLFLFLSGILMFLTYDLEENNIKHSIQIISLGVYVAITYYVSKFYFKKINLNPPKLIGINFSLFMAILIGIFFALIIQLPYRIYAIIRTGDFVYIFLAFNIENFIKALGAGIFEEITFRGTLLNFFNQKNKKYLGLIISSLIFGLIHIGNSFIGVEISLIYIIYIIFYGFSFGLIYLNFGLIASISAHVVGNFLIGGFIKPNISGFYYNVAIIVILCVWLFFRDKRKQGSKSTKANNVYN
ncbi:CPBP family intramembrane glutamic endopeptidase [Winogradskyella vincentii]|uniref:CPBP family intramembrane metalloprotease n=1 Tax=Winogradskyella vincentii TaxID=2877122 RepID=A0ABS7Y253_9FLAO|nr:type II CAAX endopeptidase family protein [Winogradskyella vincentii]MCA0153681.1 CPBP family intramembrane metalloprotease [Winogradskyella vincentii]